MSTVYLVVNVAKNWDSKTPELNIRFLYGAYTSVVLAADHFAGIVERWKSEKFFVDYGVAILSCTGSDFKLLNKYIIADERKQPSLFD